MRNEIGQKIAAMDAIIAQCEARFGRRVPLLDHPILGPLNAAQWRKLHVVHGRHHLREILRLRSQAKTAVEQGGEKQVPHRAFGPIRNDKVFVGANDSALIGWNDGRWARSCATAGALVWAGMAVLARLGIARIGAIELLFLFAPLVIVPLGMELGRFLGGDGWMGACARRIQPVGAALAVVAMWLPPGRTAGWAAAGWMVVCLVMAVGGVLRLGRAIFHNRTGEAPVATWSVPTSTPAILIAIAGMDLAVGGAWLVASRLGMRPMGIQEPIGLLTAVHFHYAGFATATIAAATLRFAERRGERRWLRRLVLLVAGLPYVVAAGFVISPALKMGAAILFSASVAVLAIFVRQCGMQVEDRTARVLLQAAAGAVFVGMLFSSAYAVADFAGSDVLTIPQMARVHGLLNAMGFCLLGLLGWVVEWDHK